MTVLPSSVELNQFVSTTCTASKPSFSTRWQSSRLFGPTTATLVSRGSQASSSLPSCAGSRGTRASSASTKPSASKSSAFAASTSSGLTKPQSFTNRRVGPVFTRASSRCGSPVRLGGKWDTCRAPALRRRASLHATRGLRARQAQRRPGTRLVRTGCRRNEHVRARGQALAPLRSA